MGSQAVGVPSYGLHTCNQKRPGGLSMCRAHRITVAITVAAWVSVAALTAFAPLDVTAWKMAAILSGCLAVVLVPYCMFPWLVASLLDEKLKDVAGAFLAGWEARGEQDTEPQNPARLHVVGR